MAYHETDRITDGFDIFFWVFDDSSSYVSPHWHTAIEIHYILEGSVDLYLQNQTYHLVPGDIAIVDSTVLHSSKSIAGNKSILIQIPYLLLARHIPNFDGILFFFDYNEDNPELEEKKMALIKIINRMKELFEEKPDGGMLKFNSLIFDLMYHLYHDFSHPKNSDQIILEKKSFDRIKTIMKYTNDHYSEPISIPEIASIVALNEDYFCHFFKNSLGITYLQYLNELRMSYIHKDLLSTDIPVNEILDKHGFTNHKVFRRMFLEQFKTTPAQYRKMHKKG